MKDLTFSKAMNLTWKRTPARNAQELTSYVCQEFPDIRIEHWVSRDDRPWVVLYGSNPKPVYHRESLKAARHAVMARLARMSIEQEMEELAAKKA